MFEKDAMGASGSGMVASGMWAGMATLRVLPVRRAGPKSGKSCMTHYNHIV